MQPGPDDDPFNPQPPPPPAPPPGTNPPPAHGDPVSGTPGYPTPDPYGSAAPGSGTPGSGTPGYGPPGYGTPGYGTPGYGTPGYGTPGYGGMPVPPSNGQGIAALILGILSIPTFCICIGIPLGGAGAVLGYLGMKKADAGLATNRGVALAGLITGGIGFLLGLGFLILVIARGSWHYYYNR